MTKEVAIDWHTIKSVDLNNLDEAAIKHMRLYAEYTEDLAELRKEQETKKYEMRDYYNAEYLRLKAAKKETKMTEKQIEAEVKSSEDYVELENELSEIDYAIDVRTKAKEALSYNEKLMRILGQLYIGGYFTSEDGIMTKEEVQKAREKSGTTWGRDRTSKKAGNRRSRK